MPEPIWHMMWRKYFLNIIQREKPFNFVRYPTAWVYTCCRNIAKNKYVDNNIFHNEFYEIVIAEEI